MTVSSALRVALNRAICASAIVSNDAPNAAMAKPAYVNRFASCAPFRIGTTGITITVANAICRMKIRYRLLNSKFG